MITFKTTEGKELCTFARQYNIKLKVGDKIKLTSNSAGDQLDIDIEINTWYDVTSIKHKKVVCTLVVYGGQHLIKEYNLTTVIVKERLTA